MSSMAGYTVRSEDELRKQAESQIAAEIEGATRPLRGQIDILGGRQTSSLERLGGMFGTLQPFVSGAAENVTAAYDQAQQARQAIFNNANTRLNALAQQRAQTAQALAQEMGGPVSTAEFAAGVEPSQQSLAGYEATDLLHGIGQGLAGTELANAFAGKVFPLVRTEQEANIRSYFEDQVKEIQDQISALEGAKTGKTNERLNTLLQQEREYDLAHRESALKKTMADRDWKATLRSLKNEDARLKLAQQQYGLDVTKTKADIRHITNQDKIDAARLGLTAQELKIREAEIKAKSTAAKQKARVAWEKTAMDVVDAATTGGRPVTVSVQQEITRTQALRDPKNSYYDSKTKKWYRDREVKSQQIPPMTDPSKLYGLLIGYGIPKNMALQVVRNKLGTPEYIPGKVDYSREQLVSMPFRQLRGVAIQLGFSPDIKRPKTRQQLIDFILDKRS